MHGMEWDDLRYVLALKRAGNLTGAASSLGVTRTTVGRRLQDAEERLGVRLFDRTPDGFVATSAGEEIAETAARFEGEILLAEGRIRGRDAELSGGLRVSTLDFIFHSFADVFKAFAARYPGIQLTVDITPENVSLSRREADVALRLGNTPNEGLIGRRVGKVHFQAYAARALVESLGPGATLSDYPWVHWDERSDTQWLDRWLDRHAPGAKIAIRATEYMAVRRAILSGFGTHFMPCCDGDSEPSLVALNARLTEEARDLWVLTLPDLRQNSRIRAFMDHCYDAFASRSAQLLGRATID